VLAPRRVVASSSSEPPKSSTRVFVAFDPCGSKLHRRSLGEVRRSSDGERRRRAERWVRICDPSRSRSCHSSLNFRTVERTLALVALGRQQSSEYRRALTSFGAFRALPVSAGSEDLVTGEI
jgi:hypothetical protein